VAEHAIKARMEMLLHF